MARNCKYIQQLKIPDNQMPKPCTFYYCCLTAINQPKSILLNTIFSLCSVLAYQCAKISTNPKH